VGELSAGETHRCAGNQLRLENPVEARVRDLQFDVAFGVRRNAVHIVLEDHIVREVKRHVRGLLERPVFDELGLQATEAGADQPAVVRDFTGFPEGFLP
jgi:hypothetical protein